MVNVHLIANFTLVVICVLLVSPAKCQYLDNYGNAYVHGGNRHGSRLHPSSYGDTLKKVYGFGGHVERNKNRFNGGLVHGYNRRGQDLPKRLVLI